MTSLWLLGGALLGLFLWGLHLPMGTALVLTGLTLFALIGRGLFRRRTDKVVIVQDLTTGKAEYQPMDQATRHYLASRANKTHADGKG